MNLESQLTQLENAQLVRPAHEDEPMYIFKHALMQDAAYRSLLKQDRKTLHRQVGEALERVYPEQLDEYAALLAQHYAEAGDDAKTLHFATWAGDASIRVYANTEALVHYEAALKTVRHAEQESQSLPGEEITHLYKSYGRALELASHYKQAAQSYQELETLGRKRQDRAMELAALLERAKIYGTINSEHDPAQGKLLSERALKIAREIGDRASECQVLWNLQITGNYSPSDSHDAVAYGEQALAIARSLNLREQLAYILSDLACSCWGTGEFDKGQAALAESRQLWQESSNLPMLSQNGCNASITAFLRGEYAEAIKFADEGDEVSRSSGNLWGQTHSHYLDGYVRFLRGELDDAIGVMNETVEVGEQVGHPVGTIIVRGQLAWVYGTLGDLERGYALAEQACALADAYLPSLRAWALAVLARLQVLGGELARAQETVNRARQQLQREAWIPLNPIWVALATIEVALARGDYEHAIIASDELLEELRTMHIQPFMAEALRLKGVAQARHQQTERAEENFARALAIARQLGERYNEWRVLMSWSRVAQDAQRADELSHAAQVIVADMAERAKSYSPELGEGFLARALSDQQLSWHANGANVHTPTN